MNYLDEQLNCWRIYYGIPDGFIIEEEAKETVLQALSATDVLRVWIDQDNALVIEFEDPTETGEP
jgi:hypothetical protein